MWLAAPQALAKDLEILRLTMTLYTLLIGVVLFLPLVGGIGVGVKWGIIGTAIGGVIGAGLSATSAAVLRFVHLRIDRRVRAATSTSCWLEITLAAYFCLLFAYAYVSLALAGFATNAVLSFLLGAGKGG